MALAAVEEALAEQETVLPGGGHVPAVPVAVYGYCPECGGAGVMRERRPNGDDKCTNGHKYSSSKALAEQPAQQEPYCYTYTENGEEYFAPPTGYVPDDAKPLYTSPSNVPAARASKPLTDEQIWDEVKAADLDWQTGWSLDEDASNRYITFARAIEAAHGITGEQHG